MVSAYGVAQHLVHPVRVGCAQGRHTLGAAAVVLLVEVGGIVAELVARQYFVLLVGVRNADVTIVAYLHGAALLTGLGGDDDDTVAGAATIDGRCAGVLQYGEGFDVLGVHHGEGVRQTLYAIVIDGQTVDDNQRVVAGRQGRTTADADAGTTARGTIVRDNAHTGNLTHNHVLGIGGDALRHFVGLEGGNRTRGVSLADLGITNDHGFVQNLGILLKHHIHVG